jgi:hypothetical protein
LLLHQMLRVDELTGSSHARVGHWHAHCHRMQAAEVLRKIAILGVRRGFLEGAEAILSFIVFFLATVVAVRTFRAITTLVCATMSNLWVSLKYRRGVICALCNVNWGHTVLGCLTGRRPCYSEGRCRVSLGYVFSRVWRGYMSVA